MIKDRALSAAASCPAGSLLLFDTSGLTDVLRLDTVQRSELLRATLASTDDELGVEELCDRVLRSLATPALRDDVALMARVES